MTTWYVATTGSDSNPGTAGSPFLTIAKGCTSAAAGDTVTVADGNYQGSIYITTTSANGTSSLPITLKSTNKYGAKIKALSATGAGSGNNAAFEVRRDWWIIDGFEVDGSGGYTGSGNTWTIGGTPWHLGIFMTGSNCITKNCHVHDLSRDVSTGGGGAGIQSEYFYGGNDNQVLYCWVHNIGPVTPNNFVHGIYISTRAIILGNLVYKSAGTNIHSWHAAQNVIVANNTSFSAGEACILLGTGDGGAIAGGLTGCRTFNNICRDSPYGIIENGTIGAGHPNLFDHNLVYNCTTRYSLLGSDAGTQTNDTNADPLMVSFIAAGGGDYHLLSTSPVRNIGIASLGTSPTGNAPTIDIDGTTRPLGAAYDYGAYEFVDSGGASSASPTGVSSATTRGSVAQNRTLSL